MYDGELAKGLQERLDLGLQNAVQRGRRVA
jgi:hypothetical protein